MSDSAAGPDARDEPTVASAMLRFFVPAGLALALLGVASLWLAVRSAQGAALDQARRTADRLATAIVQPGLTEGLIEGRAPDLLRMGDALHAATVGTEIVAVRLWDSTGTVVYADEPRLIGEQFPIGDAVADAAAQGGTSVAVSDLAKAENRYEQGSGPLVEAYRAVTGPDGQDFLFEAYSSQAQLDADARQRWLDFAPLILASLVVLAATLSWLGWITARRLAAERAARLALLQRALDASDLERQRIAADLHDGVVQDLAGLSFGLAALADQADAQASTGRVPPESTSRELSDASARTRAAVRSLRSLLVDIYPPNLERAGLGAALTDLASGLPEGMSAALDIDPQCADRLSAAQAQLCYRVAREALTNVVKHSGARAVGIRLRCAAGGRPVLEVTDDGRGFDPTTSVQGRWGLRILTDLATASSADLGVATGPGGTAVRLTLDDCAAEVGRQPAETARGRQRP